MTPPFPNDPGVSNLLLVGAVFVVTSGGVGLYAMVKASWWYRARQAERIGSHVVVPVQNRLWGDPTRSYRCQYCGRVREEPVFFADEECLPTDARSATASAG